MNPIKRITSSQTTKPFPAALPNRLLAAVLTATALVIASPANAQAAPDFAFTPPMAHGQTVDNCAVWGINCGWGGAHQFCQLSGFAGARSFQLNRPGRTFVIGANRTCEGPNCVGFSQVVCAQGAVARPPQAQPGPASGAMAFITGRRWSWSDNTHTWGTLVLRADGGAQALWNTSLSVRWEFVSASQIRLYSEGTRYVTLLTWDGQRGMFVGRRDARSGVQDNATSFMRPI